MEDLKKTLLSLGAAGGTGETEGGKFPTMVFHTLPSWIGTVSGPFGDDTCQLCNLVLQIIIQKMAQLSDQGPIHVETKMAVGMC